MIIEAEIISQPVSGRYKERIYDIVSPWNSQQWTWVKFINEDGDEWCGHFRGAPKNVAVSRKYNTFLVLTSDYLYQLDCHNGELIEYDSDPAYQCVTVSPFGDFVVADYYTIEVMGATLDDVWEIETPIEMDNIAFNGWSSNKLSIICEEFLSMDKKVELELDCVTWKAIVVNK